MISELDGKGTPVEAWVSFGPPSQRDYRAVRLNVA
jgi:hypothetical protein